MSELMEHESIDDVAGRAVAALRREVAARSLPELNLRTRRRWVAPVVALAALAVVVIGLIAIGANRNDSSIGNDPNDPRWIVTDLPDGMAAVSAEDASGQTATYQRLLLRWAIYATNAAPLGPVVAIVPDQFSDMADPASVRHIEVQGRPAVVGQSHFPGVMWLDIELTTDHWVGMTGAGVDEAAMLAIGAQLTSDAAGLPILSDPASVGLTFVGAGDPSDLAVLRSDALGTTTSTYRSAEGEEWTLSVGPATDVGRAWAGMFGATSVNGDGMFAVTNAIFWEQGELAFRLETSAGGRSDQAAMVRAARSVRPASGVEWSELVAGARNSQIVGSAEAVSETSISNEPPGSWTDVHVHTSVAKLDAFHYLLTFTLPNGSTSTAEVQLVGRSLDCGPMLTGISGGVTSGGGTVCLVADPNAVEEAAQLRIYGSNGLRYIVDTQTIEGVTFAVFHIDGTDTPRFDVVDEDGTIEPF
jgi:hypothetical protein